MTEKKKSVFGPIISRRLGVSLGVDLLPFKTCSLDCVYCECGATTNLTMERGDFYPVERVLAELDAFFEKNEKIDYVTFSGVGEPTLHTGIGRIIRAVKSKRPEVRIEPILATVSATYSATFLPPKCQGLRRLFRHYIRPDLVPPGGPTVTPLYGKNSLCSKKVLSCI